jgi:hypothetical protein
MCMRTNMIDAFLVRREGIFRCQWQRGLQHCLSCTSANQPRPVGVLLNKTCDNNEQRARMRDGELRMVGGDVVAQAAPRSGGRASVQSAPQEQEQERTHSVMQ